MRNWNYTLRVAWDHDWRFQTTYEELKPEDQRANMGRSISASRLPMRNWNFCCTRFPSFRLQALPDYLWGIETYARRNRNAKESLLPDYLWGIETEKSIMIQDFEESASRLPMRNWNRREVFWACCESLASRLPMRNWNKTIWISRPAMRPELPDYLWGIETVIVWSTDRFARSSFQTTYEELKHFAESSW